jgi:hypothetical protein
MWLLDSKPHETFLGITIDREWCETDETSSINLTFGKGLHVGKGALSKFRLGLISIGLALTPSLPLYMSCLSSNPLLNWWQTPWVLQSSPLKRISSRDSGWKIFKGREESYPLPTLTIVMSYIASSNKEAKLVKTTFWYLLFVINFVWRISFISFHEALLLWEESKTAQYFFLVIQGVL